MKVDPYYQRQKRKSPSDSRFSKYKVYAAIGLSWSSSGKPHCQTTVGFSLLFFSLPSPYSEITCLMHFGHYCTHEPHFRCFCVISDIVFSELYLIAVVLGLHWLSVGTRDRKVACSTPGRRAIKTQLRQLSLPSLRGR